MNSPTLQDEVRQRLYGLGFSMVRFAQPPLGKAVEYFEDWLARGYDGEMGYLRRRKLERQDPEEVFPRLKSIIVVAFPYDNPKVNTTDPKKGNISRYAWGQDYHLVLPEKLRAFQSWLTSAQPETHCYFSVDAGPVLEKAWAAKAGLGWAGKHTNIIHESQGSYFFLSVLYTDLEFAPDPAVADHCGSCEACIDVCPTGAIVAPYVLDASRCISYLTIELKGPIPQEFRSLLGNHIFGCDDCQEVCPWNRFSMPSAEEKFQPRAGVPNEELARWVKISRAEFKQRFKDSPISRAKWKGFLRNILVAIGNSGDLALLPLVEEKLSEAEPLVRGHAVWALRRLKKEAAIPQLQEMAATEQDSFVLEEIQGALKSTSQSEWLPSCNPDPSDTLEDH